MRRMSRSALRGGGCNGRMQWFACAANAGERTLWGMAGMTHGHRSRLPPELTGMGVVTVAVP